MTNCSIEGCGKPTKARGWCGAHYMRQRRHGNPLGGGAFHGELLRFIETVAVPFTGNECLIWPFGKDGYGYGQIKRDGRTHRVHRLVCEKVHGQAPTPKHDAAHSCGNGHLGCCNPAHLRWATRTENKADELLHGTRSRGERHGRAKITEAEMREIRRLRGKMLQREIGDMFGISYQNVSNIQLRKRWTQLAEGSTL